MVSHVTVQILLPWQQEHMFITWLFEDIEIARLHI